MNLHSKTVIDLILKEQDKEIQDQMMVLHKQYKQALAGIRMARETLKMIDNDLGTDHSEILEQIKSLIASVKWSEIGLHEMISDYAK